MRFPISAQLKKDAVNVIDRVINDEDQDPTVKARYLKILTDMEHLNLKEIEMFTPKTNVNINLSALTDEQLAKKMKDISDKLDELNQQEALSDIGVSSPRELTKAE